MKLHIDAIYDPGLVDAYCKAVWQAIDKLAFVDEGRD
jgi:hypothetical protein